MSGSRPDPAVQADGVCARPGCLKLLRVGPPKTMPKWLRPTFELELAVDPWCSSDCCREWHEAPRGMSPTSSGGVSRAEYQARASEAEHGTESRYVNQGCRCDDCRAAAAKKRRARRAAA